MISACIQGAVYSNQDAASRQSLASHAQAHLNCLEILAQKSSRCGLPIVACIHRLLSNALDFTMQRSIADTTIRITELSKCRWVKSGQGLAPIDEEHAQQLWTRDFGTLPAPNIYSFESNCPIPIDIIFDPSRRVCEPGNFDMKIELT